MRSLPTRAVLALAVASILAFGCSSSRGARSASQPAPSTVSSTNAPRSLPAKSQTLARTVWPGKAAFVGPEHLVPAAGITVGYRQFGHGPDLVLLEGEEMTMSEWPVSTLADLAAHYRVTMFDGRGVDRTTDDLRTTYSIEQLADDTAAFIDALGLKAPFVYGLSTGGEVGLALAVRHPDHVSRLAVSGATTGGSQTVPPAPAIAKLFNDPKADPVALVATLFPAGDTHFGNAYLGEILTVPQTLVNPAMIARQVKGEDAFIAGPGLTAALHNVHLPVLVMNGGKDQLVPPENARRVAVAIPGSQLDLFADAGHMLLFQDRVRFVAALRKFFG